MTMTETTPGVEFLLDLDFEPEDTCEWGDCYGPHDYDLHCSCGVGVEASCTGHARPWLPGGVFEKDIHTKSFSLVEYISFPYTCRHEIRPWECTITTA